MQTIHRYFVATCFVIAGLVAICTVAEADTALDDARKISWTATNLDALKRIFGDIATVNSLFLSLLPDADSQPTVGDYTLVDLRGDGNIQLVATVAFSRAFYNHLYIVSKEDDQFNASEIFTGGPTIPDLKSSIVDLNGNGQKELLLPRGLAPYAGAKPIPIITDVYAWNGKEYKAADNSYTSYYRDTVLPRLHAALDDLESGKGSQKNPETKKLLKEKYLKEIQAVTDIVGQ